MNVLLWILQWLLAVHTAIGAVWKFTNSEQAVPSLSAIPHSVWVALIAFEFLCALGLVLPAFNKRFSRGVVIAAAGIAAEMLLFCAIHIYSGDPNQGPLVYWLVVAVIAAFVAYGRKALQPLR
ncbi:DoxX family protein [Bdellovibrio sp. 22V]|uniref:DoxX family protein n=1 Tax=Bdellovibrio sp. 22V TaxID=3044166 RepID=UPI002543BF37|nr:DoxX family protein [Bdellovibrio sp. 22V]WII71875.1 DoxX family protein [Bdellovibrio sp. 22V]